MIFRSLIPPSNDNANLIRSEHFLVWLSPDTGLRQWLFANTENEEEERTRNLSVETRSTIRSIPTDKVKSYNLTALSLDSERYDYVASIMDSNQIYKVSKDNELIPLGIEQGRKRRSNDLKEFEVEISVFEREVDVLNL